MSASRRACGQSQLRPVGPVPLPGVSDHEATRTSEQDHSSPRAVVGKGMTVASRWACGRRPPRPIDAIPFPGIPKETVGVATSEQDDALPNSVVGHAIIAAR